MLQECQHRHLLTHLPIHNNKTGRVEKYRNQRAWGGNRVNKTSRLHYNSDADPELAYGDVEGTITATRFLSRKNNLLNDVRESYSSTMPGFQILPLQRVSQDDGPVRLCRSSESSSAASRLTSKTSLPFLTLRRFGVSVSIFQRAPPAPVWQTLSGALELHYRIIVSWRAFDKRGLRFPPRKVLSSLNSSVALPFGES